MTYSDKLGLGSNIKLHIDCLGKIRFQKSLAAWVKVCLHLIRGGSRISQMRGTTQKGKGPTSYLAKFWRKLHKYVEKIGPGEALQNVYYIDPPLLMTMTTTLIFRIRGSKCGWMMTTTTFCRQWCEFKSVQWPLQRQQQCSPAETYLMIVFFHRWRTKWKCQIISDLFLSNCFRLLSLNGKFWNVAFFLFLVLLTTRGVLIMSCVLASVLASFSLKWKHENASLLPITGIEGQTRLSLFHVVDY